MIIDHFKSLNFNKHFCNSDLNHIFICLHVAPPVANLVKQKIILVKCPVDLSWLAEIEGNNFSTNYEIKRIRAYRQTFLIYYLKGGGWGEGGGYIGQWAVGQKAKLTEFE